MSPARVDAVLAAAYVLSGQNDNAAQVLSKSDPSITASDIVPVFRLANALMGRYRNNAYMVFPVNYLKLCFEHTNLSQDEHAVESCHVSWIRLCRKSTHH